ncbi:MAG: sodium:calcium antiporter [Candidatus Micrarchaeota archaeon]
MRGNFRFWLLAFYSVLLLSFANLDGLVRPYFSNAPFGGLLYPLLFLSIGFFILLQSVQILVKALVELSRIFGISEFTTSFLVIGIAAILPEFSISLNAAIDGNPSFALGLLMGSNVTDLTLILGAVAIFASSVKFTSTLITRNFTYYLMLLSLPVLLMLDGEYSRLDGLVLLVAFALYAWQISTSRKSTKDVFGEVGQHKLKVATQFLVILLSLFVLFSSANIVSDNAISLASILRLPAIFLGVLIAAATCLPELTFSLEAIRAGRKGLGLGDILGNVATDATFTLGLIAFFFPFRIPQLPIALLTGFSMVVVGFMALQFIRTGRQLDRKEGLMLLLVYFAFIIAQFALESSLALP